MAYAQPRNPGSRQLEPHHFGPLSDQPVVDTGNHDLFPGEDQVLSRSSRKKTRRLVDSLSATLDRVVGEDENVLYVAAAHVVPTLFEQLGLGLLYYSYHQVALVLTERRLIEVLLDRRGKRPEARVRTWSWAGLKTLKFSWGKLKLAVEGTRKVSWKVRSGGDRKLIKLLLPKIRERAARTTDAATHRWLCPQCGAANEPQPTECTGCRARFRSPGFATVLALAFPGGGLFYARRPVLGTLDLLGELMLFMLVALSLATAAGAAQAVPMAGTGVMLLALTKLESVHISRVLVRRSIVESDERRAAWRKTAIAGGTLSGVALIGALAATGSMPAVIEQDLTFVAPQANWTESRSWSDFIADNDAQRSQWTSEDGTTVFVAAYPLGLGESWPTFRSGYLHGLESQGLTPTVDDAVPQGFTGFRSFVPLEDGEGTPIVALNYLLWDQQSDAVHHVYAYAVPEFVDPVAEEMAELMAAAAWIPAVEPQL